MRVIRTNCLAVWRGRTSAAAYGGDPQAEMCGRRPDEGHFLFRTATRRTMLVQIAIGCAADVP